MEGRDRKSREREERQREREVREGGGRRGETEVKASGQVSYRGRGGDDTKRSVIYPPFPVARGKCAFHSGRRVEEEGGIKDICRLV